MDKTNKVVISGGYEIELPEPLRGLGIKWGDFEFNGSNDFAMTMRTDMLPAIDELISAKRNKLEHNAKGRKGYIALLDCTRELTEAMDSWRNVHIGTPYGPDSDGKNMWEMVAELFEDEVVKSPDGRNLDFAQWEKDTGFVLGCVNCFHTGMIKKIDAMYETDRMNIEKDIAVAVACRKMIVGLFEAAVYQHALIHSQFRDKKACFKGVYASLSSAHEGMEVVERNRESKMVNLLFPNVNKAGIKDSGDELLDAFMDSIREQYEAIRALKKLVNAEGTEVLRRFDGASFKSHCRKELGECIANAMSKLKF